MGAGISPEVLWGTSCNSFGSCSARPQGHYPSHPFHPHLHLLQPNPHRGTLILRGPAWELIVVTADGSRGDPSLPHAPSPPAPTPALSVAGSSEITALFSAPSTPMCKLGSEMTLSQEQPLGSELQRCGSSSDAIRPGGRRSPRQPREAASLALGPREPQSEHCLLPRVHSCPLSTPSKPPPRGSPSCTHRSQSRAPQSAGQARAPVRLLRGA